MPIFIISSFNVEKTSVHVGGSSRTRVILCVETSPVLMMDRLNGSKTALAAAMLRAAHQLIDEGEKLLEDAVILKLIGEPGAAYILANRSLYHQPGMAGMRSHVVLRSRFAEDELKIAYRNSIRQCLILGAGTDTFAYRQPGWAKGMNIIEADYPAGQAEKLALLGNAGIVPAENVGYLPVDLEKDDLQETFKQAIDPQQPLFVVCLGVLIYLSRAAVDRIFQWVSRLPKGSIFIFTASEKPVEERVLKMADQAAFAGEPWVTFFEPEKLIGTLLTAGFSEAAYLTVAQARSLYYSEDSIRLPPPRTANIVKAVV